MKISLPQVVFIIPLLAISLLDIPKTLAQEKKDAEEVTAEEAIKSWPDKPTHPPPGTPEERKKAIESLIDKLADISDNDELDWACSGSTFSPLDDVKPPSLFYGSFDERYHSPEAIRTLVSYGAEAVPCLIAHLCDQRKTKISPTGGQEFFRREYDYN